MIKGFNKVSAKETPRLIVAIDGREKHGKTHFSLTAPGPIALFNMDMGLEGVIRNDDSFGFKRKVWEKKYRLVDKNDADRAKKCWSEIASDYTDAVDDKDVRTICIDTATEMWEILRIARFGRLTQVMPFQYGPVNAEYRELIRQAYASDKNLILIHKLKDEYVNDKRTGKQERAGFSDTKYLVQANLTAWRDDSTSGADRWNVEVSDCRQNMDIAGMDLQGVMCNFWTLGMLVFPDTNPEYWGAEEE